MDYSRPSRTAPLARAFHSSIPLAAFALLTVATGCSDVIPAAAATRVDQMFEGVAVRFSPNVFDARYNVARVKLAQSALVPSRIFDDTAVWSARPSTSARSLFVNGTLASDGKYHFETHSALLPATHAGDSYHSVGLEQVASNQFRWDTRVDLALGSVTADDIAGVLDALLRAPEGRNELSIRDDYHAAFPHAMAAFGRGFVLDSATITPAGGATGVALRFAFRPDLMKPTFPGLAGYLDKYLGPAKYHFVLTDRSGAPLFDVLGRDRAMTIRYRVEQGKVVSMTGPAKPWPDSLSLLADVSVKVKLFTVGVHQLNTDFVISNTTSGGVHERGWTVVAQREPKWDLPLITERLIRSPLRHPFEGQGSSFRLMVRDSAGGQTLFSRRTRLEVQESAIMRFIGSLASRAMGDLDDSVEQDEHRFMREGFLALQRDLRALRH
ncbi:MAG TPA: hypothetical protein VGM82_03035 [Gemmatimonadaceae bacterium]